MHPRNRQHSWPTFFGILTLLVGPQMAAAQKVHLAQKFTPGRTAYVEETTEIWLGLDGEAPETTADAPIMHSRVTLGVLETVESQSENGVRLRRTVDRIAVTFDAPLLTPTAWDSDGVDPRNGSPVLERAFTPLLNLSYTIDLDVGDSAAAVGGLDQIRTVLDAGLQTTPATIPVAAALSESHIHRQWSALAPAALLPGRRLEVGQRWIWDGVERTGPTGNLLASYACTLEGISTEDGRRVALVVFHAVLRPLADQDGGSVDQPSPLRIQAGNTIGRATFDALSGRYVMLQSESRLALCNPQSANESTDSTVGLSVLVRRSAFSCTPGQRNKRKRIHGATP